MKKKTRKSAAKTVKKPAVKKEKEGKLIGEVAHFFSNINVAVIKLTGPLALGDSIRIIGGEETDFNQEVESMEIDHEKIKKAKKGEEAGMKVKEKVREGYKVYKV
jgi:translation elongation factor EF-1alpha